MGRKGVLLVDDEAMALKYFSRAFAPRFTVFSAASTEEALRLLERHHEEIGVIVTDQRMPESTGVDLLKLVRKQYPHTVRILTTAYSELDLLIEAINTGAIYSFVSKPWQLNDLEETLVRALDHYESQISDHRLLEQKLDDLRAKILENRTYDVALIAAKIGHYVHNALCPVTLLIDQLLDERETRAPLSNEFLRSVNAHIHEIANTLKDLAQISMPPNAADFCSLNLAELLANSIANSEILRKEKGLRLEVEVADGAPTVFGVPMHMEKLFRFMIAEEVVSLPSDSLVKVRIQPHRGDDEPLGVTVEFEDFAPISSNTTPDSLLHPFNLRGGNPREFGVFLASSYFIARHHGGTLSARVKEDMGLVFTFFLPSQPQSSGDANEELVRALFNSAPS
jgi:FixJ family two-component response regulator